MMYASQIIMLHTLNYTELRSLIVNSKKNGRNIFKYMKPKTPTEGEINQPQISQKKNLRMKKQRVK